jgi:hypothetical protein
MTQTGQQNHYDIKYLRGYGSQISVKNQRIVLKNGIDVFTEKQEIEEYVPTGLPYSRIIHEEFCNSFLRDFFFLLKLPQLHPHL